MQLNSAIFYSNDLDRAYNFYHNILKVELEYRSEDRFLSFIFSNNVRLGIKKAKEEREVPGKQTIFIEVENIEEFYNKAKDNKLNISKELTKEDWATNFSILDPDLNKIQFISTR